METTKKTAHIAEALKNLHQVAGHVLDAMTEQLNDAEAANNFMLREWQPKVEPVETLLQKLLADIVNDNALTAAATKNEKWAL